ncbi:TetR/AcrR family transcriptional regulator [Diaphorobacter sp.]|uniref:TetR/AcrR family transcriptional regulator n=1 Tax=Diaphorobacter sp. TaxID=1934310 RepID=UPI003D14BF94
MARKAPRRTAERILEASLALFNRFGEPNVSTMAIAADLRISTGNLYYHYPAKDKIVTALFARCEEALRAQLATSASVTDAQQAWVFVRTLLELIWDYRFLYRDLNNLLSCNRQLEARFPALVQAKTAAMHDLLQALGRHGALQLEPAQAVQTTATSMAVLLTYWLSFEYVRDPRSALEPANAQAAPARGAQHVMGLLMPCLAPEQRTQLAQLAPLVQLAPLEQPADAARYACATGAPRMTSDAGPPVQPVPGR